VTNNAREGGVDSLHKAAKALNLDDEEGRNADGVGVAHSPKRERSGGAQGEVKEGGGAPGGGRGGLLTTGRRGG
jgi:hypothetical protein